MNHKRLVCAVSAASLVVGAAAFLRTGISAEPPAKPEKKPGEKSLVTAAEIGGESRFLTHVSTDKPVYRPGEKVYARGVVLAADTRAPVGNAGIAVNYEIKGPKGDVVARGATQVQESVAGIAWEIPATQAGGEYKIKVTPSSGDAPGERKFDIRAYRALRLKNQIVFVRDGYGPGDAVSATLRTERAEGGVPAGAKVTIQAYVDGTTVAETTTSVDPNGIVSARFDLPKEIARGEGTLAFIVEDGGVVETASKSIPILLQTIDLSLFPEGGELVAGLPNRIYISALTPAKKPADLKGIVVDSKGNEVATLRTEHEGRGRTTLTPKAGEKYTLKITEPAGIKTTYPLPDVKASGAIVSTTSDVTPSSKPVVVKVGLRSPPSEGGAGGGGAESKLTVQLRQREKILASEVVATKPNQLAEVALDAKDAAGVLIVTVWKDENTPLAERLVFREPKESVNITVTADRGSYTPGSPAKLKVKTTSPDGKPVSAVVGLTVTDDSVLEMIEKREQAPRLPVMVLLEDDVKDLADAHVYLDPKNEKAPVAVDLLLATQGWRRFAFVEVEKFLTDHSDSARRVVAMRTPQLVPQARFFAAPGGFGGGGVARGAAPRNGAVPPPAPAPVAAAADQKAKPGDPAAPKPAAEKAPELARPNAPAGQPAEAKAAAASAPAQLEKNLDRLQQAAQEGGKKREAEEQIVDGRRALRKQLGDADFAWVVVREFAHQARADRQPGDRVDFTETLYWNAGVKTNAETGEAEVAFAMSDAVTSFRVLADAFNAKGGLGTGSIAVESVEPFYVEPKLPLEVTSGDVIQLPLGIVNRTTDNLSQATLAVDAKGLQTAKLDPFALAPEARLRRLLTLNVGTFSGKTTVTLNATAGPYADKVTRPLSVAPFGFPIEIGKGGMLAANETKTHELVIPGNIVPGSLTASVAVYPTPLASMTAAMEALIRQPNGCFEQTSSTTYPLVMAQQYFTTHTGISPETIQKAGDNLDAGYKRLIGFECKSGGYEWFGQDPGHEALTAYGLLEFTDMSAVRDVDKAMLERTRAWLLTRRDGNGGFKRERRALHTWIEDKDCSNAYITWSLLRSAAVGSGAKGLESEVATVKAAAAKSSNTYVIALAANVLHLAGDKAGRNELLDKLVQLQEPNGALKGATTSIVGSGGEGLIVETTALATLAWLYDQDYIDFADKGVKYLAEVCKAGRYGSTQSTVLAVQAIVEQDKALARPKSPGSVQLLVDNKPVGEPVKFDKNTQGAIQLPDMGSLLTSGKHTIAVKMEGGSSMPHVVAIKLHSAKPDSSDECALRIETSLADRTVAEGAVTEARVKVTNTKDEAVPTPIALVGIPGGLEVRHDQLKELVKQQKIAAYEVIGRDVVLYWREMGAKQSVELPVSLVAAVPGEYAGPASRTYLYYTDELKQWSDPLKVKITARAE